MKAIKIFEAKNESGIHYEFRKNMQTGSTEVWLIINEKQLLKEKEHSSSTKEHEEKGQI